MTTPKIYDRRAGEGTRPYHGFRLYCDLGPERSLEKVATTLGKSRSLMAYWSAEFAWVERAAAFDADRDRAEQEAKAKAREEWAARWERRRLQSASRNWATAGKLRRKAEEMLAWPLAERVVDETDENGNAVRITHVPAKWSMTAAAQMFKTSAELQAQALAEALGGETDDFDPTKATPEECREYLQRQGLLKADGEVKALPGR